MALRLAAAFRAGERSVSDPNSSSGGEFGEHGAGADPRFSVAAVRGAYDAVAADYAAAFADDLNGLALDRAMLDAGVVCLPRVGMVLDIGCGPASVAAYLQAKGAPVVGADLAPSMLAAARLRTPSLPLVQADMRHLPFRSGSLGAVVVYYAIQHLPRADLPRVLHEVGRLLGPDGLVIVATHLGDGEHYIDEFLGHRIDAVGASLYRREELLTHLAEAGFEVQIERERGPLAHQADTRRIYLLANRRPAA